MLQIIAFIFVTIGTITDLRTLEVPDWLNYTLIALGLAVNTFLAIVHADIMYVVYSFLGLGLALIIGVAMFYSGQWGGGDSKMLFGLGALFGFTLRMDFFAKFLLNLMVAGAFYGVTWIFVKALMHVRKVQLDKKQRKMRILMSILAVISLAGLYIIPMDISIKVTLMGALLMLYMLNYLLIVVRAVEEAMIHNIAPQKLTEGDWLVKEIWIDHEHTFLEYRKEKNKEELNRKLKEDLILRFLKGIIPQPKSLIKKREKHLKKKYTVPENKIIEDVAKSYYIQDKLYEMKKIRVQIEENPSKHARFEIFFLSFMVTWDLILNWLKYHLTDTQLYSNKIKLHIKKNKLDYTHRNTSLKDFLREHHHYQPDKKYVAGPSLGVEKHQIKEILDLHKKGIIEEVQVKYGMPFVPAFWIGLVYTIVTGEVFLLSFI